MDWSKAKTILIVAFIITNSILGFVLFKNINARDRTLSSEFMEEVKARLVEKNIKLNTEIPKEVPGLNTLVVEYEVIDIDRVNRNYFGNEGKLSIGDKNSIVLTYGDEKVVIRNQKILNYENYKEEILYEDLDEERVIAIAEKFLNNRNVSMEDKEINRPVLIDDQYHVKISKVYNDRLIEKAYINMVIDKTGVRSLEKLWLEVTGEGEAEVYINSAGKALLDLVGREEAYNRSIDRIELIYYFDPEEHEYIKNPKMAKKGRTIPAWIVYFSDGGTIILDSY